LMQSSQTCRVPLAQLRLATRLSQLTSSVETVDERSTMRTSEAGPVDDFSRSRLTMSSCRSRHVTPLKGEIRRDSLPGWENMDSDMARRRNGVWSDLTL
jgi:transcriptional activator HAC1